jgi:hypothetical protein
MLSALSQFKAGAAVDPDFFGGEPFHAAGEAEAAAGTGQRAEAVSQQRPGAAFFGQAVVVVRFAVMNVVPTRALWRLA